MKLGSTVHPTPTEAEQLWLDLSDRFYEQLERRGERAAVAFAKRAGSAALNGDTTVINDVQKVDWLFKTQSPPAILAGLRGLRAAAELHGDVDAADDYNDAIKSMLAAGGITADDEGDEFADDGMDLSGPPPPPPASAPQLAAAAKMSKLSADEIKRNQQAVTNQIAKGYRGRR